MPPPRVEVGRVGLNVLVRVREPVRVEHELVGGEEDRAEVALDALGPGGVVPGGHKLAPAAPGALMEHLVIIRPMRSGAELAVSESLALTTKVLMASYLESKVFWQFRWGVVTQETLAKPLCFSLGDHAASS